LAPILQTTIMTRHFLAIILTLIALKATSQKMTVITLNNSKIEVAIISDSVKQKLLQDFNGKQDNTIRKQWTARTYRLSDNRLLVEFYDRQAVLINNSTDFEKLKEVRFIKTYIEFLKKNISYKIELTYDKGKEIVKLFNLKKLDQFKSELLDFISIEVYELTTGQILFLNETNHSKSAAIYENIKALSSECNDVQNQFYGDLETSSEKFINGDPLLDYENDGQWVYPKDQKIVIQNHKLGLVESKVYVETFYGNLYKSENGYYVLINEINQKNGAGNKMRLLTARVYESIEEVRKAEAKYENFKNEGVRSEHFYQKISDK
jgi:regulator of sigma D